MWEERQREVLMEGQNCLNQSSRSLLNSERSALVTEVVGASIMSELESQRETLLRASRRLSDVDVNLSRSRRILLLMKTKFLYNKILLVAIILIEGLILSLLVYSKFFK